MLALSPELPKKNVLSGMSFLSRVEYYPCFKVNSASYPQQDDGKLVVASATWLKLALL